jgi:precorrin-8X/cobalt-precorrin-8 methylmutase
VTTARRGHQPHPIEVESYRIMRSLVDLSALPPLSRAVAERIIHASAELGWAEDLVLDEAALEAGRAALAAGAPVVTDVGMVVAGLHGVDARCYLRDPRTGPLAADSGLTRSAAGIRVGAADVGPGAVWAIGSAPTALAELLRLDVRPALVIGLPVGFVGAVEAKAALRASGLPALSNRGVRGGSPVAAAAVNALRRLAGEDA